MNQINRGQQAERILQDELYQESFEKVRASLHEAWESSAADAQQDRETLWVGLKMLDKVEGYLIAVMNGGKIEADRLAKLEKEQTHGPDAV